MDILYGISFVLLIVQAPAEPSQEEVLCTQVTQISCKDQYAQNGDESVCGSDGKTYSNQCFFAQAKCKNKDINIVCHSSCASCYSKSKRDNLDQGYDARTPKVNYETSTTIQEIEMEATIVEDSTTDAIGTTNEHERILSQTNLTRTRKNLSGHHVETLPEETSTAEQELTTKTADWVSDKLEKSTIIGAILSGRSKEPIQDKISVETVSQSLLLKILTPSTTLPNRLEQNTRSSLQYKTTTLNMQKTLPIQSTTPLSSSYDELFCKDAVSEKCPKTLDPLCGTDNKFYLNICVFKKAKCKDRTLDLQDLTACRPK